MFNVYVLECVNGFFYVGKTHRPVSERMAEHQAQKGCEWTRLHPPLRVTRVVIGAQPLDEDRVTKEMMHLHGVNRVRGGSYSAVELPTYQAMALRDEMCTAEDRCLRCQRRGHFARACWARTREDGTLIYHRIKRLAKV